MFRSDDAWALFGCTLAGALVVAHYGWSFAWVAPVAFAAHRRTGAREPAERRPHLRVLR